MAVQITETACRRWRRVDYHLPLNVVATSFFEERKRAVYRPFNNEWTKIQTIHALHIGANVENQFWSKVYS